MNLKNLALLLTNNGYKARATSEHSLTINDRNIKIVGNLCIVEDNECCFGSCQDLLLQLWSIGMINSRDEAISIGNEYQSNN